MPQNLQRDTSWFGKTWPPWWGWWCSGLPTDSALSAAAPSAQSWTSSSRQETCEEKERKKERKEENKIYIKAYPQALNSILHLLWKQPWRREEHGDNIQGSITPPKNIIIPHLNLKMQSVPWDELLTEHLILCPKWSRDGILGQV